MKREALPFRKVLQVAAQRRHFQAGSFRVILELLSTAAAVRTLIRREFSGLRVGELDFEVLVSLYAMDPASVTPSVLAAYTATTRPSITEAVDRLELRGLTRRERDTIDRRSVTVHLTPAGTAMAQECIRRFIAIAAGLAVHLQQPNAGPPTEVSNRLSDAAANGSARQQR